MEVHDLKQLLAWQPPKVDSIISHGILHPHTKLVVFGLWKSWKSMLIQHTAFCLASGTPWLGFDTAKSPVLTVQLEIPMALHRKRVAKYAKAHNLYPEDMYFATQHYLKLDRSFGIDALEKAIVHAQPTVLIIDPLYKVLSGNISDAYDMMKLLDNLDQLRDRYKITLILVTHSRIPHLTESGTAIDRGLEDMMGSSYLPDWLDASVHTRLMAEDPQSVTLEISFDGMRHAEEELPPFKVRVSRRTLGFHRLGLAGVSEEL